MPIKWSFNTIVGHVKRLRVKQSSMRAGVCRLVVGVLLLHAPVLQAQYVALKNNLLYDAVATPNLQLEVRLAPHWSLQAGVGFNPFPIDDQVIPKWRHVAVDVAPRYWFCDTYTRDFVSLNIGYSHFNVAGGVYPLGWLYRDVQSNRFQGDALIAGASYGWHFAISPHFSIELEGGVDGGYTWYDKYTCVHCGKQLASERKWFAVPRVGVSVVVLLDGSKPLFEERCNCGMEGAEVDDEQLADSVEVAPVHVGTIEETPVHADMTEETIEETIEETLENADTIEEAPLPEEMIVPEDRPVLPSVSLDSVKQQIKQVEKQMLMKPNDSLSRVLDTLITVQTELAHQDQMQRLRETVLRPYSEYTPYDPDEPVTTEPNSIYMHFDVDKTSVDRQFIHNDELLDSIMQVIDEVLHDTTVVLRRIKIVGMASFDGPYEGNVRLAQDRAMAIHDYIQRRFEFDEDMYRMYNGGECWQELRWFLQQETFVGKYEVLQVIKDEEDYERRERYIKRLYGGETYEYMRRHFQRYLRNLGTITIYYEKK